MSRSRSLPVPEFDVESEIYQSLYGAPRRERRESGPGRGRIVIVDGALSVAPRDIAPAAAVPPSQREATSARPADRLADGLVAGIAALRDRPEAMALIAALVVVPVLALVLASAGRSTTVRGHLAPAPSRLGGPAFAAAAPPAPASRHTAPRVTPSASASAVPASGAASVVATASNPRRLSGLPWPRPPHANHGSAQARRRAATASAADPPARRPRAAGAPSSGHDRPGVGHGTAVGSGWRAPEPHRGPARTSRLSRRATELGAGHYGA